MAIDGGLYYTVALKRDGTVVAWGDNQAGQTDVPAGLGGVRAIAAGDYHTVALKRDGMVVSWGSGGYGQTSVPQLLRDIMAIDAGGYHTVALRSNYRFGGFLGPVNALPVVNTLNAGAGVPVKFSLGGNKGLGIFASGYPVSRAVACSPNAPADEIERTVKVDASSLRFDASTNTYTYVWKTASVWSGQCRRLVLRFADGIEHTAVFGFR